ncbi:MAG: ATP-binding protein [Acidimicrobiales bacterium]
MHASVRLPCDRQSARLARRFVAETLSSWLGPREHEVAELLTGELVTNAVLHAHTEIAVTVSLARTVVRIEVEDGSDRRPEPVWADEYAGAGRGLRLVDDLADGWGVEAVPGGGKSVWFVLDDGLG